MLIMTYNLTLVAQNATSVHGFIQGVNSELALGWLGLLILIGLATVMATSFYFRTGDFKRTSNVSELIASELTT